jgi:predicted ester cyclase
MSEENKVVVRRYFEEILDGGNLGLVDEIFDPQYVLHDPNAPEPVRGLEGSKHFVGMFRSAFPDIAHTIEDQAAEGDKVVTRLRACATHRGELMGIPPTGKEVTIEGISIWRIANGKIKECWFNYDALGLMQQLGAFREPERQPS